MSTRVLQGDALEVLRTLSACSVQCVVTSPPYYGLRDYGTAQWEGGKPGCDHKAAIYFDASKVGGFQGEAMRADPENAAANTKTRKECPTCGARRVDDQIGLEESPEAYIARLIEVFREVRRVLKDDGTLWVNMGDSYAGSGGAGGWSEDRQGATRQSFRRDRAETIPIQIRDAKARVGNHSTLSGGQVTQLENAKVASKSAPGLKPKDLIGVPWMLAFALRTDGWYLRSEIIWHKPNPMPESATDRPTKSHEQIFLLSKSARYFYDTDAIAEASVYPDDDRKARSAETDKRMPNGLVNGIVPGSATYATRNRRDVWTVTTKPYKEAHFATFPPDLIEPCILAGTSARGECPKCGRAWERIVEKEFTPVSDGRENIGGGFDHGWEGTPRGSNDVHTIGWRARCECGLEPVPQTVLDPFNGSGTTGAVSLAHRRDYIGIELNPKYIKLTERRFRRVQPALLEGLL